MTSKNSKRIVSLLLSMVILLVLFMPMGQVFAENTMDNPTDTSSKESQSSLAPVVLEDFENGLDRYLSSAGAQFNIAEVSIEKDEDLVRFGNGSLKLKYDFIGKPGTSGAYLQTANEGNNIEIPGYPKKISMWVYGDGKKHWLRAQLRDSKGTIPLNFVEQNVGIDWVGWRYLEVDVPEGRTLPLTMDMPVRYMEPSGDKKDAGVIYVDQIRALYAPNEDDLEPPILKGFSPAEGESIHTNQPMITVYAEDVGYDPINHPETTLIDPDRVRFFLDGVRVQHMLNASDGKIQYIPATPLADGIHEAKATVRDMAGNMTTRSWTFNIDTGSSKLLYDTPQSLYSGNTYTLNIKGMKSSDINGGQIKFAFDPSKVENLQFIIGDKLNGSQVQAEMDSTKGTISVTMDKLSGAALTDDDSIGQIQYAVKKDATGTNVIAFESGSVSFVSSGGSSYSFFGFPLISEIKSGLSMSWQENGNVEGFETVLTVVDEWGSPAAGAQISADGLIIGSTDSDGKLVTGILTSEVKTYPLQAAKGNRYSPVTVFKVSPLSGTAIPYNINVSMGEDPSVSRGFTWHTNPGTEATVVEFVKEAEFSRFDEKNVMKAVGTSSLYQSLDIGTVRVHKATVTGLEPGTAYVYRVGDDNGNYSPQGTFQTTEISGNHTKFLYFADSQAADIPGFQLWGNTVKTAFANVPDAEFMVHAGDMVEKGFNEQEWKWWFSEAQEALLNTTLVSAIGNHEVMGNRESNDFLEHFNQPGNGVESLKGSNFSFDYKDVHFMVLNSEYQYEEQEQWLEKDLSKTNKKWKIAIFHRGPYGSIYDTADIRRLWAPVLEEHKVDLVLNGHDHIYLRTYPMMNNEITADGKGTTYVIAGSTGPKFYSQTKREWQRVTDEEKTQMYASVDITGDELKFVTQTVSGRIVDEFTLTKGTETPVIPPVQPDTSTGEKGDWVVSASELESLIAKGEVIFNTDKPLQKMIFPGQAAKLLGNNAITVNASNTSVILPAEFFSAMSKLVSDDQLEGSTITWQASRKTGDELVKWLANAEKDSAASLTIGSDLLTFNFSITTRAGETFTLSHLNKAITILLPVSTSLNSKQSGVYGADENGKLIYLGGAWESGKLKLEISELAHSYVVLEFNKSFSDTTSHWINSVIKELAAKHLIEGISKEQFAPNRSLTRAEMTAMLVRLLDLKGDASAPFTDVSADKWYAESVSAAVQAGIVKGVGEKIFMPNAPITRQDAVAMIVRAFEAAGGQMTSESVKLPFTDLNASAEWVKEYVGIAFSIGLVEGQSNQQFNPEGIATRAEGAQLIYNILKKLSK